MRKIVLFAAIIVLAKQNYAQEITVSRTVGEGRLVRITPRLADLEANRQMNEIKVRDENGIIRPPGVKPVTPVAPGGDIPGYTDVLVQNTNNNPSIQTEATINVNYNGMGFTNVNPPDPSLAAGPNHVIQMINGSSGAYFRVYDKSGNALSSQTYLDNLTGYGGLGDPIVLYDHLADRFVMTEFANKSETTNEGLIIAVSQTANPLGSWYVYFFSTGTTFPDYPKFSVWPDGYYATSNDFANGSSYDGSSIYAFDRAKMLAGQTLTTYQQVKFSTTSYTKYFTMCPVLLQGGTLPPAGTGGLIAYMFDDSWTSTTADRDSVGLMEYKVNWTTPSSSVLVNLSSLQATDFKSQICTASRGACIPQPGTTTAMEALHQRVMNQPVYRNFGNREGIVMTHVVDKGSNISAIRWYELSKTSSWGILQQSTYSPDNVHRWMPSISYDRAGNIALAYNVSDASSVYPGIRFTGRKSCDPANSMTYPETVIVNGTSRNGSSRYGDYNHLTADPDGNSFWFTAEWNSATTWSTRIANFNLDNCSSGGCTAPGGLSSSNITSNSATVSWSAVSGANSYDVDYKVSSSSTWTNAATATTSTSVNLTGLTASTTYDWRVRANCSSQSSTYSAAQFTTLAATCNTPTNLTSSSITSNSATVSWNAVSGANNYDVDYKVSSSSTWTNAATATTSTSVNLTGLTASTTYDWRVRANCTGASSSYAQAQFTTAAAACSDPYESNNTRSTAAAIAVNTDLQALISSSTDIDWFKFNNTSATPNIRVRLFNLPADYDIELYRQGRTSRLARSQNAGTNPETIIFNTSTIAQYELRVYGYNGVFNTTSCYTLRVDLSGSTYAPEGNSPDAGKPVITISGGLQAYPNPAKGTLSVAFESDGPNTIAQIRIMDIHGKVLQQNNIAAGKGVNITRLNVGKIPAGIYILKADVAGKTYTTKVVIAR